MGRGWLTRQPKQRGAQRGGGRQGALAGCSSAAAAGQQATASPRKPRHARVHKEDLRILCEDGGGAVAVVQVEVQDEHALQAVGCLGVPRRQSHIVQQAVA